MVISRVVESTASMELLGTDYESPELRWSWAPVSRAAVSKVEIAYGSVSRNERQLRGVKPDELKRELVRSMLTQLSSWPRSEKIFGQATAVDGLKGFDLAADPMGKPILSLNGNPGPAVSFTTVFSGRTPLRTWVALSAPGVMLGVDAALEDEFSGAYPFQKVFRDSEWDHWLERHQGKKLRAAAMLWSAKEATVKALGSGWGHIGPLDLEVKEVFCAEGSEPEAGLWFRVGRPDGAALCQNVIGGASAIACAVEDYEGWLSIAVIDRMFRELDGPSPVGPVGGTDCESC